MTSKSAPSRSLRGTVVRLLTGLAVIFGLTVAVAGPASAHHPGVTGSIDCYGAAKFDSVSWSTGAQGTNGAIKVDYSTNNGASWTTLTTGAYNAANNYRFSGSVNVGSATQVKFRATATQSWGNGTAGGQVTYSSNYPAPTNCDKSKATISYDCENYTVKLDNRASGKDVTFIVTENGVSTPVTVTKGQTKDIVKPVTEGTSYTITVKSGTTTLATSTFTVDCDKSKATVVYDCTGYTVKLDNTGSTKDVTFTVVVNGTSTDYTVPQGQTKDVTGTVAEDSTNTITVKSGTTTLATSTFTVDCVQPAAAVSKVDCTGYAVTLDNTKSTVATTFVVDVQGVATSYTVPPGQSQPVSGAITGTPTTVTVTSNGTSLATATFSGTCTTTTTPPPPTTEDTEPEVEGVQASGKAIGTLKVTCQGTVRVVMQNKSSSRAVYTVKVAKKSTKIAVKADSNKRWETTGKAKQVAKLLLGKKVLASKQLPAACRRPEVLPDTGKRPVAGSTARVAATTLRVPSIGVDAVIKSVGLTSGGGLAVGPSVNAVYTWGNGVKAGQRGSTVVAGHTYSRGAGVFDNLGKVQKGNRVFIGKAAYKVTRVQKVNGLSRAQVRNLFSDQGKSRAVLITCGDRAADGVYHSRILVFAAKA